MGFLRRSKSLGTPTVDPGVIAIADAGPRRPVRVRGQITRMKARPTDGLPSLAVSIADNTGSVTAVWTGRRSIGGISLGRTIVIEGVAVQHGDHLEFNTPMYELQ
jgi:hypothetical protein